MKEHLLSQVDLPVEERKTFFVSGLFAVVSGFVMDSVAKANLKARILEAIEDSPQRRFFIANFFAFNKRLVSSAMLFALVFGMFAFVNVDTRVVRAAGFTKLDDFSGGVLVERGDTFVEPYLGMEIFENDEIVTGEDGEVVISYFDDSVSRLAAGSKLVINVLDSRDAVRSYVEVSLHSGVMWSRVVDLVESKSAFVVDTADVYTRASKAAFNLSVDDDVVEIGVFSNAVNLNLGEDNVKRVVSGKKATVTKGTSDFATIEDIADPEKNLAWVQSNLESDKVHIGEVEQRLLAAKMEAIGMEVDDEITYENSLRENALVFLTFDDVKKKQLELDLAEKKFIAAQVQLHGDVLTEEEKVAAESVIADFAKQGEEFGAMVREVGYTDEEYAAELRVYLEDKILASKKELAVLLPDSPVYGAKEAVEQLELSTAEGESDVVEIKLAQAAEKLSKAEEVAELGDAEMASELIKEYKSDVSKIEQSLQADGNLQVEFDVAIKDGAQLLAELEGVEDPVAEPVFVAEPVAAVVEPEPVVENPYGVTIQGDKPLSPLF